MMALQQLGELCESSGVDRPRLQGEVMLGKQGIGVPGIGVTSPGDVGRVGC